MTISFEYLDLIDVFFKEIVNTLLKHGPHNLTLEIFEKSLFEPLYNLLQIELEIYQKYILDNLAKRFIQLSTSLIDIFIYL